MLSVRFSFQQGDHWVFLYTRFKTLDHPQFVTYFFPATCDDLTVLMFWLIWRPAIMIYVFVLLNTHLYPQQQLTFILPFIYLYVF